MVAFGAAEIGTGHPCYVTFEAGPTHDGVASAKRLIELAASAGADAIKFQILDPDRLVADPDLKIDYEILVDRTTGQTEKVSEPLYAVLKRRALSADEWREVKAYSDRLSLAFFATVGFPDEVALLEEIGCHSIKIASADVNHMPLIRRAAETGMCLQLDTGNSTIGEIETAVDLIRETGNENIIIHHCPSGYPARLSSINLNVIPTLKRMFPFPIAFSDHTPGWEMDIAALALGADLVEKSITEDRTTRSIEHMFSLEPAEMVTFIQTIRAVETALGTTRRIMHPEERQRRDAYRRSIHAARDLNAGHILTEDDLDYRRPGYGLPPNRAPEVIGRVLRVALKEGEVLGYEDIRNV